MKVKKIKLIVLILLGIMVCYGAYRIIDALSHFAGSYPYSENYKLDIYRNDLILKLNNSNRINPEYQAINLLGGGESEELSNKYEENFYRCYFYLSDKKMTLHCVINTNGKGYPTILQLTGISRYANFASWEDINTDQLSKKENKEIKKKFETEILNNLGVKWKHD